LLDGAIANERYPYRPWRIIKYASAERVRRDHYETYFPLVLLARSEADLSSKLLDHAKDQLGVKGIVELTQEANEEEENPDEYILRFYFDHNEEVEVERFTEDV
jgi:hypothetical protein